MFNLRLGPLEVKGGQTTDFERVILKVLPSVRYRDAQAPVQEKPEGLVHTIAQGRARSASPWEQAFFYPTL